MEVAEQLNEVSDGGQCKAASDPATEQATEPSVTKPTARLFRTACFVWIDRSAREWTPTLVSLLRIEAFSQIFVGFASGQQKSAIKLEHPKLVFIESVPLCEAARVVFSKDDDAVLVVTQPIIAPSTVIDNAVRWMSDDQRVGTVSFLSNSAGYLSFPHRNTETPFGVDGHNEVTLTQLLRTRAGGDSVTPLPLPVAEGGCIVVSRYLWEVCGDFDDAGTGSALFAVADMSLRATRRGFINYADLLTYVTLPWDGVGHSPSVLNNPDVRHALHKRHHFFPGLMDYESSHPDSLLGDGLDFARAKALGLRVLIDGSVLGPKEMGTQLLILQLSHALAQRDEVQFVAIGVPDPSNLPPYARSLRTLDKIRLVPERNLEFEGAPFVDVIHRPFQPSGTIPWSRWRGLAKRGIVTIQDLIAYRNGSYFPSYEAWQDYRGAFRKAIYQTDAVVSISHDVVKAIHEERMPIDDGRLFVIENGADARSKDQATRLPTAILERGWASRPFLVVLGASYAHKNRDLAMRVWANLRREGLNYGIVLVGASVPYGSTRTEEAEIRGLQVQDDVLELPEVESEERNWLLKNASLAIYLTSAEGFGQVPFEAALMNVPTLFVSFGPLRELIDDPSLPVQYDLDGLTARARQLLSDPEAARASIKHVLNGLDRLTWAETARKTVDAYFKILQQPPRVPRN